MKRKQTLQASVAMCQKITLSIATFLLIFGVVFSAHYVRAEGEEVTSDTPSEVSEPETTDSAETLSVETMSDEEDVEVEVVEEVVDVTSDETGDEVEDITPTVSEDFSSDESLDEPLEEVFEMFSSFAPMLMSGAPATSSAAILTPSMHEDIHGVYTFTAEYNNPLFEGPYGLRWAIRADGLCDGDTPAVPVFGNVDGATTSPAHTAGHFDNEFASWDGVNFSATLDFSELPEGEYCFAFNPNPKDVYRQTVRFNHVIPRTGSIVISKDVLSEDDSTEFSVTVFDGSEGTYTGLVSEVSVAEFNDLEPGTYTITENETLGYHLVSITSGEARDVEGALTVEVVAGETVEVLVTNERGIPEEPMTDTLTINKNVIDKNDKDISDNTSFEVTVFPLRVESRVSPIELIISEDAPASIELISGVYEVCEVLEEGSDYEVVNEFVSEKGFETPTNCRIVFIGEGNREITFTNRKLTEEESGRRSSRRHPVGGSVLGAFTGDSSNGGSCGMYLNSYMKMGGQNDADQVRKLQAFLNEQGHIVPIDGFFGASTDAAVKAFQRAHTVEILAPWGITDPTGYVYKMTRYVMNNMVCSGSEATPVL